MPCGTKFFVSNVADSTRRISCAGRRFFQVERVEFSFARWKRDAVSISDIAYALLERESFRARCLDDARALTLEMIATPSGRRAMSSEPFTVESSSARVQVHVLFTYLVSLCRDLVFDGRRCETRLSAICTKRLLPRLSSTGLLQSMESKASNDCEQKDNESFRQKRIGRYHLHQSAHALRHCVNRRQLASDLSLRSLSRDRRSSSVLVTTLRLSAFRYSCLKQVRSRTAFLTYTLYSSLSIAPLLSNRFP